jgi:hypothetical protein
MFTAVEMETEGSPATGGPGLLLQRATDVTLSGWGVPNSVTLSGTHNYQNYCAIFCSAVLAQYL